MTPDDILTNADRLISDARYLYDGGRIRSAATLIVVALEQFGAFVEALTLEKYPGASVHMGLFGDKANAHAKRQDALASHVMGYVITVMTRQFLFEIFFKKTGCGDFEKFTQWLFDGSKPIPFTDDQLQRMYGSVEMKSADLLLKFVRSNRLKQLREFGLYEHVDVGFSDTAVGQVLELAESIQQILAKSRHVLLPAAPQIAGINMAWGVWKPSESKQRADMPS
jgi:AbiV family abortive infection protein